MPILWLKRLSRGSTLRIKSCPVVKRYVRRQPSWPPTLLIWFQTKFLTKWRIKPVCGAPLFLPRREKYRFWNHPSEGDGSCVGRIYDEILRIHRQGSDLRKGSLRLCVEPDLWGVFLAAALIVEKGVASIKRQDAIVQKALGMGVGPFTAHNLAGGNPLTQHGLMGMTSTIMPWYRSPRY